MHRLFATRPLIAAFAFEGMLIPLALALSPILGVAPWAAMWLSVNTVFGALALTVPLILGLALFAFTRPGWFRDIESLLQPLIDSLFRGRAFGAVVLLALVAGFGEELLFRGVVQAWLAGLLGPWPAVVLSAIAFGLAHYLSRAYFVLATGMGLYLGALYHITGNLSLLILIHALYDVIAILYLTRRADQSGRMPPNGLP